MEGAGPLPEASYESITQRIAFMSDSLSGTVEQRWFPHDADARPLHLVSRHQATLERRALDTVQWILCLLNIPSHATRLVPRVVAQEFSLLVDNHTAVWRELLNWASDQRARLSPGEAAEVEQQLRQPQRQLAFSHEVIYKSGQIWEYLVDLMYLQCRDGGNIYDANVMPEMKLTYKRAYEMRRMLNDPPAVPVDPEGERKRKKDMEILIQHLLEQASTGNFRKRGNIVYEEKRVEWKGALYATGAWVPASFGSERGDEQHTIESFVLYFCKRDLYPEMFDAMIRSLPVKKAADLLEKCDETDFPYVHPKRHLLSFRNGIYNTQGEGLGSWHEYGQASRSVGVNFKAASAKYFDMAMPDDTFQDSLSSRTHGWWNIQTPYFQSARYTSPP